MFCVNFSVQTCTPLIVLLFYVSVLYIYTCICDLYWRSALVGTSSSLGFPLSDASFLVSNNLCHSLCHCPCFRYCHCCNIFMQTNLANMLMYKSMSV